MPFWVVLQGKAVSPYKGEALCAAADGQCVMCAERMVKRAC